MRRIGKNGNKRQKIENHKRHRISERMQKNLETNREICIYTHRQEEENGTIPKKKSLPEKGKAQKVVIMARTT